MGGPRECVTASRLVIKASLAALSWSRRPIKGPGTAAGREQIWWNATGGTKANEKAFLPFDAANSRVYLPRDSNGESAEILLHTCAQITPFELFSSWSQGSLQGSLYVDQHFHSHITLATLGLKMQWKGLAHWNGTLNWNLLCTYVNICMRECFFLPIDSWVVPLRTLLLSMVLKPDSSQLPAHQWWNARRWSLSLEPLVAGRRGLPHFHSVGFIRLHYSQAGPLSTEKWNRSWLLVWFCFNKVFRAFDWFLSELFVPVAQQKQTSQINQCLFVALRGTWGACSGFGFYLDGSCKEDKALQSLILISFCLLL